MIENSPMFEATELEIAEVMCDAMERNVVLTTDQLAETIHKNREGRKPDHPARKGVSHPLGFWLEWFHKQGYIEGP